MKAQNINEAWTMAAEIFPTPYHKDEQSSERAGYNVYRSDYFNRYYCYICELGDRLEINLDDGRTINIWINPEDEREEISRHIAIIHAAREHGAQIRPHHTENRIKIEFAIDGDDWSSDREKIIYKALKNVKHRAEIISELIIAYCEANAIPWGTLDTTNAQHFSHGNKSGGGHFIISAYITLREE